MALLTSGKCLRARCSALVFHAALADSKIQPIWTLDFLFNMASGTILILFKFIHMNLLQEINDAHWQCKENLHYTKLMWIFQKLDLYQINAKF